MADLSCERRTWRACSPLGLTRVSPPVQRTRSTGRSTYVRLSACVAAFAVVAVPVAFLVAGVADDPQNSLTDVLLWPAVALIVLIALFAAHILGTAWWANGAGEPVLTVDGGMVRGRLSSARRRGPAYDGWDFELPLAQIVQVRLSDAGYVAIDLPPSLAEEILARPRTRAHARHWQAVTGTPAAWPARSMLRRHGRDERLALLVAALSGSHAAAEGRP